MCSVNPTFIFRFKIRLSILLFGIFVFMLSLANAEEFTWRLVYSSDFHGELKPCGCSSEGNLGGILRRASYLKQLRQDNVSTVYVSAGDVLGKRDEQGIIKSRYMMAAHELFSLDAILPGERDLEYSDDELSLYSLPWVLTNQIGSSPFLPVQKKIIHNQRMFIFGLLDPALLKPHQKINVTNMKKSLLEKFKSLKITENDVVVVLVHTNEAKSKQISNISLVDVVVRGHLNKPVNKIRSSDATDRIEILAAGHRGQRIGVANFNNNGLTKLSSNEIMSLSTAIPDEASMTKLYIQYDQEVSLWYKKIITARKKSISEKASSFATDKICGRCHLLSTKQWQKSRHATALKSLVKVAKDNDPECLKCHNTGFGEEGGFLSQQATPELANVQCEACHGSAQQHATYPLAYKPEKALNKCIICHTTEHSPSFNWMDYWPKVFHQKGVNIAKHNQEFSPVQGEYTVLNNKYQVIINGPILVTEFFNFYCNRCYILNKDWKNIQLTLSRPVLHQQIPIIFNGEQLPLSAIAFLAAVNNGQGEAFKSRVFKAKFEDHLDIDEKITLLTIAKEFGIEKSVSNAFDNKDSPESKQFLTGMAKKEQLKITGTPTLLFNYNLKVTPKNTGDNINLMIENIEEILLDIQCLQHGVC